MQYIMDPEMAFIIWYLIKFSTFLQQIQIMGACCRLLDVVIFANAENVF